jgi:hypothetical protein
MGGTSTVTGVTYGGFALTNDVTSANVGGSPNRNEIWGSDGVTLPSGAQTVVITFATTGAFADAGAITVTGSNTTTCFSNVASATNAGSTTPNVTITSAVGELIVDIATNSANDTTMAPTGGTQTQRWSVGTYNAGSSAPGASSLNMAWSMTGFNSWVVAAASFKAAGGGGGPVGRGTFAMMGVG